MCIFFGKLNMIEVSRVYGVRPKLSRPERGCSLLSPLTITPRTRSPPALTASESDTALRRFTQRRTHVPPFTRLCASRAAPADA